MSRSSKPRNMSRARGTWIRLSNRLKLQNTRNFCSRDNKKNHNGDEKEKIESSVSRYNETYKQLANLDFMKAAKILFTEPPKKKKFGFDFHLVQFFIACLPSLAVYLVAQYARREMKRMDAELEEKRKKEEGEKAAEEEEQKAKEEREKTKSHKEFAEVKERLNKLEETIKEVIESKQRSGDAVNKTQEENGARKKQIEAKEEQDNKSELGKEQAIKQKGVEQNPGEASSSLPVSEDQKGKNQDGKSLDGR